jgi:hypothetical protein
VGGSPPEILRSLIEQKTWRLSEKVAHYKRLVVGKALLFHASADSFFSLQATTTVKHQKP